ncbi:MAG: DUF2207 domain-containing protein [Candidatus Berkelbacteria bacterium]
MKNIQKKRFSVGFYWRKFAVFTVVAIFVVLGISQINYFRADSVETTLVSDSTSASVSGKVSIDITSNGEAKVDGKTIYVKAVGGVDELRLPVISKPGTYIDSYIVTVNLPSDVAYDTKTEIYGVHGVDQTDLYVRDSKTIVYTATGIGPDGDFSIVAGLPRGTIHYPIARQFYYLLLNIAPGYWLALAIILPLITMLLMLDFMYRQYGVNKVDYPTFQTNAPPMALPPAIVGALFNQKVTSREIAATVVDLAIRGNIYVIDRERDFGFAKNKEDHRLLGYEKILMSKLFNKNIFSGSAEIEKRINNHLYSKKISLVSASIYAIATSLGYFKSNPQTLNLRYRLVGSCFFLVGLAGFVSTLLWFREPPYAIYFWIGMMVSALVIAFGAARISMRTEVGLASLTDWLAFKNYLSDSAKIEYTPDIYEMFLKYLPYAMVLDCEVAWAKRFSEHNFVIPDWFITDKGGGLQDFCLSLFPLVSYIGQSFAALREPGFD